jgi:hypothetical protein
MGRPSTKPAELRDGFYIEIRNKGAKHGIRIRRNNEKEMLAAVKDYERTKDVIVMGEYKNGKAVATV